MIPHTPTRAFSPQPSVIHGSQYQSVSIRQGSQSTHLARTSTSESSVFGGHENDSFPHCHPKQQMNSTSICEQIRATRIPCSASRDLLAHTPSLCKDDNLQQSSYKYRREAKYSFCRSSSKKGYHVSNLRCNKTRDREAKAKLRPNRNLS